MASYPFHRVMGICDWRKMDAELVRPRLGQAKAISP